MGPRDAQRGHAERSAPLAAAAPALALTARPAAAAATTPLPRECGAMRAPPPPAPTPFDFAAEYQRAYRVLWVVAAGVLGRSAGAEDVVQEAALLALRKLDQFEPGTHFAAWMAQMVRFVALNHVRKRARGHAATLDETDGGVGVPAHRLPHRAVPNGEHTLHLGTRGEIPASQRNFDDELMRALGQLTEVARACLLLRTVEGLDYEQIGRVLGIPEGTAMSHVHRSRMRLRAQLADTRTEGRRP